MGVDTFTYGRNQTMRHKGSERMKKILGPGVMSALQVWLWLLIFIFQNSIYSIRAAEPGYLDFDNLPETNFSCAGKVIGGYYADLETDCQMFHVCTIGQLEEPMDIKFLCLNGTVFDQETRVCERVDEVDCSKSEHFYSLNLELYGNTAPPIIKAETSTKKEEPLTEDDQDIDEEDYVIDYDEPSSTTKATTTSTTTTTTTRKPTIKYTSTQKPTYYHSTEENYDEDIDSYDLIDDNDDKEQQIHSKIKNTTTGYHDTGYHYEPDSQTKKPVSNEGHKNKFDEYDILGVERDSEKTTDVDNNSPNFNSQHYVYHHNDPHELVSKSNPAVSFQQQSFSSDGKNSHVTVTTHTAKEQYGAGIVKSNPPNKNIQLSRTYLVSSTPQTDSKAEKNKNNNNYNNDYPVFETPNRTPLIPTPEAAKNQPPTGHPGLSKTKQTEPLYFSFRKPPLTPQGFKSNPINVRLSQKPMIKTQAKPFQSYQPSERHEVSINTEFDFVKLSPTYPQEYAQYHYERKRSQDSDTYESTEETSKSDSVTISSTPYYNVWSTRSSNQTKSLPRVIVTASASVSDSNGKKLNYTVGNILHAVKPLIPTNYDNYKESDVLLDPFFLDVPKLKKSRSKRNVRKAIKNKRLKREKKGQIFLLDANEYKMKVLETTTMKVSTKIDLPPNREPTRTPLKKDETSNKQGHSYIHKIFSYPETTTATTRWVPPDYVDDNYEPQTYKEPNNMDTGQDVTTKNRNSNTTLDISKFEATTVSFAEAISNINSYKKGVSYKLQAVHTITISEVNKHNDSAQFSCLGKKYYKFYSDKTNCRTFHMCSPGLDANQVLDIVFSCNAETFFNPHLRKCVSVKPNDCVIAYGL